MTTSTPSKHALSSIETTLGPDLLKKIQECQILLVGAGGIGCELLKNLALSGFHHVCVMDMDTIDVSNLNRQLLFRSQHVGQPKCTVAVSQVISQLAADPTVLQYTAKHGNVCDNAECNVQFVKQFDLVLNALDNVTARRRMNRLCLAASVPLIEAGTTGYLGQVNVIHTGTACYECQTQEQPKVYPICTIRSTPSMPVHTIVWAKELYKLLFAEKPEESMLFEDPAGEEPSCYMDTVEQFRTLLAEARATANSSGAGSTGGGSLQDGDTATLEAAAIVGGALIIKLYVGEIQKQLDMDRYKTAIKKPSVLTAKVIADGVSIMPPTQTDSYNQMEVWTPEQCVAEFISCLQDAVNDHAVVLSSFDKDDELSMRFVTAASSLRSGVFGIEPAQSYYSTKGIAGNIIPAIATTNAICAGLQILQAFHVLRAQLETKDKSKNEGDESPLALDVKERCAYINCLRNKTRNGLLVTSAKLEEPNPNCFVCKSAVVPITLNTSTWTMQDFLNKILKQELGFEHPTILLDGGDCIWEEGEGADQASFEANLLKFLPNLPCGGIKDGAVLTIEDFSQDLTVSVSITHQDVWDQEEGEEEESTANKYFVGGVKPVATRSSTADQNKKSEDDEKPQASDNSKPAAAAAAAAKDGEINHNAVNNNDDDDIEIVVGENNSKRSRAKGGDASPDKKKKAKVAMDENTEVIEID